MPSRPEFPVSGAQSLIGYTIELDHEISQAEVILEIGPQHLNRNGSLHGGILAMMLDSAAGFAAALSFGGAELSPVVTVSLTTQFISSVSAGRVVAIGRVSGGGRKIIYADAELRNADGKIVAKATGVFKKVGAGGKPHANGAKEA